jgi:hypothetical protein
MLLEHLPETSIILYSCENSQCSVICKSMPVGATVLAPLTVFVSGLRDIVHFYLVSWPCYSFEIVLVFPAFLCSRLII